ncbi:MAG: LPS export ABC transporter periplasmic protein LptC [Deltaproteobacteria bacterium]|nr:LPS export ABC transporter periplasmic protein LptC [Deltaproteobacteria bacterium]
MRHRLSFLPAAFAAGCLIVLLILLSGRFDGKVGYKTASLDGSGLQVRLKDIRYTSTRYKDLEWELEAEEALRTKERGVMELSAVRMVFYEKAGRIYTLKAKDALWSDASGDVEARGRVVFASDDGSGLRTENLVYTHQSKKLSSKVRVEIFYHGVEAAGTGMLAEMDTGRFVLLKDVRAVFRARRG